MNAFKIGYKDGNFVVVPFESKNPSDETLDIDTNVSGLDTMRYTNDVKANCEVIYLNSCIVENLDKTHDVTAIVVRRCKNCGKYFVITKDEWDWFKGRQLNVPKRCRLCRKNKNKGGISMNGVCLWITDVDGINWYTDCGNVYFPYVKGFSQPDITNTDKCPWCGRIRVEDESNCVCDE